MSQQRFKFLAGRLAGVAAGLLSLATAGNLAAQPRIAAVVNGASYEAMLAPGCWMSIFGTELAPDIAVAQTREPLPTELLGVSVSVGGIVAPLGFVSPGQINAIVPFGIQPGASVRLTLTRPGSPPVEHWIALRPSVPSLFMRLDLPDWDRRKQAFVFPPSFDRVLDSVSPGDTVILYAAGLGETDPPGRTGWPGAGSEPLNRVPASRMPRVLIGEQEAAVLFAGLAPVWPGVYQLNVRVPERLDSQRIVLEYPTGERHITTIDVPSGTNAANVTGSIRSLFPCEPSDVPPGFLCTGFPFDRSLMPQVTQFSVALDIAPGARPFSIVATGESGSARIEIDPVARSWRASLTVLDDRVRQGDYSGVGQIPLDYFMCSLTAGGLSCLPFAAGIVPQHRKYPEEVGAASVLPLPNSPGGNGIAVFTASGSIGSNNRFEINSSVNASLATFAGITYLPLGYLSTRVAPLRLYVDGKLVVSKDVSYRIVPRP